MPLGAKLLVLAFLVFAAWIVAHVALVVRVFGVTGITTRERVIAVLVPAIPGWKFGKRLHAVVWSGLLVVYVVVRVALALR